MLFIAGYNADKKQWTTSSMFRALQPAMALTVHGYDVEVDTGYAIKHGKFVSRTTGKIPDVVFLHTQLPLPRLVEAVQAAVANGQTVIGDTDDNPYFDLDYHPQKSLFTNNQQNATAFFNATSYNVVSTENLKQVIPNSITIRNMINLSVYDFQLPSQKDKLKIGYAGDGIYHFDDLNILDGLLDQWLLKNKAKFVHVGCHKKINPAGISPYNLKCIQGTTLEEFPALLAAQRFDVGLVPLTDNSINKYKSALKGMEYAATGIPFIASVHPEYTWLEAGIVTDNFTEALDMMTDLDYRRESAIQAYERIQLEDINVRWHDYERIINGH